MTWKHFALALVVLAAGVMGTVQAGPLDPSTVETLVGGGTYIDVWDTYTRNGLTGTTTGQWLYPIKENAVPVLDPLMVDGDADGYGDCHSEAAGTTEPVEIQLVVEGLVPNGEYQVWGLALDQDTQAMGFRWGIVPGVSIDTWLNIQAAPGAVLIGANSTWKVWAAPGSSTVFADGSGELTLYFNDTATNGQGSAVGTFDGVVLQAQPVPEPSTIVMLITLALGSFMILRNR